MSEGSGVGRFSEDSSNASSVTNSFQGSYLYSLHINEGANLCENRAHTTGFALTGDFHGILPVKISGVYRGKSAVGQRRLLFCLTKKKKKKSENNNTKTKTS